MNTYNFASFDLNECCEYFESAEPASWDKIKKFIVYDGDDMSDVMENEFDMDSDDIDNTVCQAFDAGVQHAFRRVNEALEAAGVDLEVRYTDLGNNCGYILTHIEDDSESFIKRVMEKVKRGYVNCWV